MTSYSWEKKWWVGPSSHVGPVRHISPGLWWKSKLCSLGIIYNATLFVFKIRYFIILTYWRNTYLCKQPVRSLWVHSCSFDNRLLIHIMITFRVISDIGRGILHWCYWCSDLSILIWLSWVIDHSNFVTELNEFDSSKIRESRNVNISICSMKIKIMPMGLIQRPTCSENHNEGFEYSTHGPYDSLKRQLESACIMIPHGSQQRLHWPMFWYCSHESNTISRDLPQGSTRD
jgi:hypothetical protein